MKALLALTAGILLCASGTQAEDWTLERSLDFALAHNPDARIAQQRIAAAQAGLEQALSAFRPRVQVQSSYTRTDNPMMTFGSILNQRAYDPTLNFNNVPDVDNFNARGLVMLPLYAGGRHVAGRESAEAYARAASEDAAAVRNALGFEVARAFYTVQKTRQFVEATASAVRAFEKSVSIAKKRLEAGTLLRSDVLDVEVRLAQAREDHVRARNAHTLAVRAMQNLLGIEEGPFAVADSAPQASIPTTGDLNERPELAAARERELAASAKVRGAQSGRRPRVNAFGSLDYDHGWVTDGDGTSYTAGVMLEWDLWDGFASRAKTREAQAQLESVREEQRKLRLALDYEVEQARLDVQAANERLAVTSKVIELATESTELTRVRFEEGLVLSTQLIDAETALVNVRVRRAQAECDQRIAVAALRKALALPQVDAEPDL